MDVERERGEREREDVMKISETGVYFNNEMQTGVGGGCPHLICNVVTPCFSLSFKISRVSDSPKGLFHRFGNSCNSTLASRT